MDTFKLRICFNAENQIYISKIDLVELTNLYFDSIFDSIYQEITKYKSEINKENFLKGLGIEIEKVFLNKKIDLNEIIINDLISNTILSYLKEKENISFSPDFKSILNKDECFKNTTILHYIKDYLDEFKISKYSLILYYDNPLTFYTEYKILKYLKLEENFIFKLKTQLIIEIAQCPKNYIVLSENCLVLQEFQSFGTWTGLLVIFVLSSLDLSGIYYNQIMKNIEIIKAGFMPNFTSTTFFQQKYLYKVIFELINEYQDINCKSDIFEKKLDKKLICVTAIRTSFKYSDYKKHRFILSNEDCIFYPHLGGNDISINKKFNVLLNRIIYEADFLNYRVLLDNMVDYVSKNKEVLLIDNLKNLDGFLLRDKMVELLQRFINLDSVKKVNEKYKVKLAFPTSQYASLKMLVNYNEFKSYLTHHNIDLPIIIKFQSESREISHQMLLIISDNGLKNVHEFVQNFDLEKTFCVIQKYSNHGGEVLKLYRYGNHSKTYFRPSIADLFPECEQKYEEFSRGYFKFRTEDLLSKKILELWNKFDKPVNFKSEINEIYLDEVSSIFQELSEKTLFGLDFLYDYKNKIYFVIDCNNFPGYKEIEKTFWKELTSHINFYFIKHKNN